jgi:hypothetical protein
MTTGNIDENMEAVNAENANNEPGSVTMDQFDIDAVLEEAAKDFAEEHDLSSASEAPKPELTESNTEDQVRKALSTESETDPSDFLDVADGISQETDSSAEMSEKAQPTTAGSESEPEKSEKMLSENKEGAQIGDSPDEPGDPDNNDEESGDDNSLDNLEKELANLVADVDQNIDAPAEPAEIRPEDPAPSSPSEEPPAPVTESVKNESPAGSSESDGFAESDNLDAAEETANGLENLEKELASLVKDIEAEPRSPSDADAPAQNDRPVDIASDAPESAVDSSLDDLEAELAKLGSLSEEPDGLLTEETESDAVDVSKADSTAEESGSTEETATPAPVQESPIVIAQVEPASKNSEEQKIGVDIASSLDQPDDSGGEIQVAPSPAPEISVPAEASSDDQVVEDEFDSILSSYKDKQKTEVAESIEVQSSPEPEAADKKSHHIADIPLTLLFRILTLLDKPFESLSNETKDLIGAAAVITSIMSIIAAIILLYLQ